jgi:outer membrane protein assembly factor BamD
VVPAAAHTIHKLAALLYLRYWYIEQTWPKQYTSSLQGPKTESLMNSALRAPTARRLARAIHGFYASKAPTVPQNRRRVVRAASLVCLLGLACAIAFGCAASKHTPTAEESFITATEHFDRGAYDLAIKGYKELLDQHPFTEHSAEAETKIAQGYYLMGRYPEAIAAFGDFERMHPTSPLVPLVNYYLGMSYLRQMRPMDRDQEASGNAQAYFRAVTDRYPGTPWAERARLRLRECEEALAAHELYIAKFYLRQHNLPAAEARFSQLLKSYANTDAAGQALQLFGDEYLDRDREELAELSFLALITHHRDDPLADRARVRLAHLSPSIGVSENAPASDPLEVLILRLAERGAATDEPEKDPVAPQKDDQSSKARDAGLPLTNGPAKPIQLAPSRH